MKTKFVVVGELKKCPHCGGSAEIKCLDADFLHDDEFQSYCTDCGASTMLTGTPESAVRLCNVGHVSQCRLTA